MSAQLAMTPEQYLAFERASEQKHEYYAGRVYAVAGASRKHNQISGNMYASIHAQLRKRDCTVYTNDMRVKIEASESYTYPDIVVVCGNEQLEDTYLDTLLNPTLLIEVLSPSTAEHDRSKKFKYYRALPSFVAYLLISQDRQRIEHFTRQPNGQWNWSDADETNSIVALEAIGCTLSLADVYEKVSFDTSEAQGEQQ